MRTNGVQPINALCILRRKLFPFSYDPHKFVEGTCIFKAFILLSLKRLKSVHGCLTILGRDETKLEIMKSIMAIYLFRWDVQEMKKQPNDPADFAKYLYQPEKDDETNEFFHHREDHNHVLKRIVNCLRDGVIPGTDLRYFKDALHDPKTGLTYEALTGKNKQSVPDCERLISPAVVSFLRNKGDESGAKVLSIISNWHKAVDGRALSEDVRSTYLQDTCMKNWLLDDWMPWHNVNCDYTTIDVNRLVKLM